VCSLKETRWVNEKEEENLIGVQKEPIMEKPPPAVKIILVISQ